ncbi:coiled-coil domain-containing protein 167 isoform X1 [Falco rusticolus]|uniref:coiled-coil domain-containing protein 167 isoform X1 n=1 Tax=Falco rusticolus TaxID=120794 RepID=UPI0018866D82|nr:coiled-coil domain-containing protein 167 isoform X1 [Falco rusticolus]XP_055672055.1 coiled-coil domain-containing protein 167 isoform X1 [Falco peregrinus]
MGRRREGLSVAREVRGAAAARGTAGPGLAGPRRGGCHRHSSFFLRAIDGLEEKLARCRRSMEEMDLKLRREKLSPEGRKSLERERNLLMTKADNYEKELSVLRKENRKNAALTVAVALLIALIYSCWTM